ncbi:HAD family hydrolase [Streptacidiphilus neutrinimicus]|uniref:HAD family hydrolase n=1 Tax=Streptacidiphilus neutrinimicus TaxID=105420 RepID=UPI0005A71C10|nr:HAD hydrolase-like protein [Streptacidiphilus neutrinimicus]
MPLIVLWDVDHTLIENCGVSKEIYAAAFAELIGHGPVHPVVTEGRTDRSIMGDLFQRHGLVPPPWAAVEQALSDAGEAREQELARRGYVLPGVRDALEQLRELGESTVSSVLTGNIRANALVKLRAFGLDEMLDLSVGAYGADGKERFELVDVARRRTAMAYALPLGTPVVLIGDTPRDVEAGLRGGAAVVAVASGSHDPDELVAAGADTVLPDLRDTAGLLTHLSAIAQRGAPARPGRGRGGTS